MLELLLIRHGQTDWNVERRVIGTNPVPLNKVGRAQVRALARVLKNVPIQAIYTSPIKRALETAAILLHGRDAIPLIEEEGLSEINYGQWVGRPFSEIPELTQYFESPASVVIPCGEQIPEVQRRILTAIDKIRRAHMDGCVIAISHADVIKLALAGFLGMPLDNLHKLRIDNGSVSVVRFENDRPKVAAVNWVGVPFVVLF